jgi:hypothetical protein
LISNEAVAVAGCTVLHSDDLQSGNYWTLLVGGPEYIVKVFGYKRRRNSMQLYRNGERVAIPASVMLAMGAVPGVEKKLNEVQPPKMESALAVALKNAGIK